MDAQDHQGWDAGGQAVTEAPVDGEAQAPVNQPGALVQDPGDDACTFHSRPQMLGALRRAGDDAALVAEVDRQVEVFDDSYSKARAIEARPGARTPAQQRVVEWMRDRQLDPASISSCWLDCRPAARG